MTVLGGALRDGATCFDRLSMTVLGGALRDGAACFDNLGMASRTPDPHLCEP
ncbi:MAG: hypothetical protein AMXMBFR61_16900 [Fimbriimonadales bacterium]